MKGRGCVPHGVMLVPAHEVIPRGLGAGSTAPLLRYLTPWAGSRGLSSSDKEVFDAFITAGWSI